MAKFGHRTIERNSILMLVLTLVVVSIGGLVEIVPLYYLDSTIEKVRGMRPYSPLELAGRNIYVREGSLQPRPTRACRRYLTPAQPCLPHQGEAHRISGQIPPVRFDLKPDRRGIGDVVADAHHITSHPGSVGREESAGNRLGSPFWPPLLRSPLL